jgi:uncharacterized membrane protein
MVTEKYLRSIVKSAIWRLTGVLILAIVTFFYTRHIMQTTWITLLHHGIFFFVFVLHERFWLYVDIVGFKRKLLKMITYETILGTFILATICLIITGNIQTMNKITITYIGIKHLIFVINEFCWEKIKWGIVKR